MQFCGKARDSDGQIAGPDRGYVVPTRSGSHPDLVAPYRLPYPARQMMTVEFYASRFRPTPGVLFMSTEEEEAKKVAGSNPKRLWRFEVIHRVSFSLPDSISPRALPWPRERPPFPK